MDENEVAQKFAEIAEIEKLVNHPRYVQLITQLDLAAIQLFNFMESMGHGDVATVKSSAYCPKGHLHDIFKYTCLLIEEDEHNGH